MTRPSMLELARGTMAPFLRRLAEKEQTQALCLLSNAARSPDRGPFDRHSDFDIGLVLDVPMDPDEWRPLASVTYGLIADRLPDWLPAFSFHVPVPWGRLEVNVNQVVHAYEEDGRTSWGDEKCEAYGVTAEFLVDRDGRFARVIERKLAAQAATRARRRARLANRLEWDISVLPARQADRGEVESAHLILDRAADELVEFMFVAAGRFLPNPKWRFLALRRHGLLSEDEIRLLMDGMRCDPGSAADAFRRVAALGDLWARVRPRVADLDADLYRAFTATYVQLADRTLGEACALRLGETSRDIANFLLLGSFEELLAADPATVPPDWRTELSAAQAELAARGITSGGRRSSARRP